MSEQENLQGRVTREPYTKAESSAINSLLQQTQGAKTDLLSSHNLQPYQDLSILIHWMIQIDHWNAFSEAFYC